ncbi:MAG: hypothetical protein UW16_C0008G0006 [Microgenomates group bacterium GW2011_GWC1_44_10]|nr:MAG: hypothetical protein UW16_C0008G0006 [Microgenomates group bacterium GW2011_GWC1_44_10]
MVPSCLLVADLIGALVLLTCSSGLVIHHRNNSLQDLFYHFRYKAYILQNMPQFSEESRQIGELIESEITHKKILSLQELTEKYHCDESDLPKILKKSAKSLFEICKKKNKTFGNELNQDMETVFLLFKATRNLPENHELIGLSKSLDNLDSFLDSQNVSDDVIIRTRLVEGIYRFMSTYADEKGVITVTSFPLSPTISQDRYSLSGDWLKLTPKYENDIVTYAKPEVVEEVISLLESNEKISAEITHSTTSAALLGVASENAIISGASIVEKGQKIRSGEHTSMLNPLGRGPSGGTGGHRYIFATNGVSDLYGANNWFDEYRVTFGTTENNRIKNLQEENVDLMDYHFMYGDGLNLGVRFPLNKVTYVYSESAHLENVKRWAAKYAPQAKVISLEAYRLINTFVETDEQNKRLSIEDLKNLLKQPKIRI